MITLQHGDDPHRQRTALNGLRDAVIRPITPSIDDDVRRLSLK